MLTIPPLKNTLGVALKTALLIGLTLPFAASAEDTTRISVSSKGKQGDANSWHPAISADNRYIAFQSEASTLVPNDTNNTIDIFVHDRQTKKIRRVNVASDGTQASPSWNCHTTISANGRYVGFTSDAPNLVPNDHNSTYDVFVHDLKTKQTTRVNVSSDGNEAIGGGLGGGGWQGWNGLPSLSADGRYVAFQSVADNLVEGDNNGFADIFVHDRKTKTTTRVSVASDGTQANEDSWKLKISDDGRYVAFQSAASNLVKGDTNNRDDIFVHDRVTKQTTRVSVATDGTQGNNGAWAPVISADGRYVAFWSAASNLVAGDANVTDDVFVHDRETHETTMISMASDGTHGNASSSRPSISSDGRYIGFRSWASNLAANDDNGVDDVFVHDRVNHTTTLVSVTLDGTSGTGPGGKGGGGVNTNGSRDAHLSPDGQYMAFKSLVTDLVPNDTNEVIDVFLRKLNTN